MIKEILVSARAALADREHWVKGTPYASRRPDGLLSPCFKQDATCFCASSAIQKSSREVDYPAEISVLNAANELFGNKWMHLWMFNDDLNTTHEMVLQAFDKAIHDAG